MRRTLALWLLLFGVYAATLGLDAFGESDYGGDEPHYLLAAESLVEDGDVDVLDEYAGARVRRLLSLRPRPPRPRDRGPAERAARGGLPALHRAGVRAGRASKGGGALPRRRRRARTRARLPAGAARGAGPVGARRGARGGAEPAAARVRHSGLPGARRGRGTGGRGAARAPPRRPDLPSRRVRVLPPPRDAAVARDEVRAGGSRDRRVRRPRRSGAHGGGRSQSARSSCRSSRSRSTWRSTRRSTAARRRTRPTCRARARPTRRSRAATWSARTGSSRCSWTASTASCAGRPSSRSPSPGCGGCGARAATG